MDKTEKAVNYSLKQIYSDVNSPCYTSCALQSCKPFVSQESFNFHDDVNLNCSSSLSSVSDRSLDEDWLTISKFIDIADQEFEDSWIENQVEEKKAEIPVFKPLRKSGKYFYCPFINCIKIFLSNKTLLNHLSTHQHSYQCPYVCSICTMHFVLKSSLKRHCMQDHKIITDKRLSTPHDNDQNTFVPDCAMCGKSLTFGLAWDHVLMHNEFSGKTSCKICQLHFRGRKYSQDHLEAVHPNTAMELSISALARKKLQNQSFLGTHFPIIEIVKLNTTE